jgi:hypothetical protein
VRDYALSIESAKNRLKRAMPLLDLSTTWGFMLRREHSFIHANADSGPEIVPNFVLTGNPVELLGTTIKRG